MLQQHSSLPGSSPLRAAPVGATLTTKIERGSREPATQTYDLGLTVLEIVRGADARTRVAEEGLCDRPALRGHEFLLACLRFAYSRKGRGGTEAASYTLAAPQLVATSGDGEKEYPLPDLLRQPEPALVGMPLDLNGSREGWVLLEVEEAEKEPLLAFHREYIENKYAIRRPVWFKLYEVDPMCVECGLSGDCL
jgi:hypothetical protein